MQRVVAFALVAGALGTSSAFADPLPLSPDMPVRVAAAQSNLGGGFIEFLFFVAILASLGSALFFLVTDRGQSKRTVKALALRVGLSLTLFLLLMAGYYFGLVPGKIE